MGTAAHTDRPTSSAPTASPLASSTLASSLVDGTTSDSPTATASDSPATLADDLVVAERRGIASMGTTADVVVVTRASDVDGDAEALAERALSRLADLEARWTRFSPDSEVSRLNAGDIDDAADLSADTRLLLDRAQAGHQVTHGRFDPYRLGDVIDAGYVASRATITADTDDTSSTPTAAPTLDSATTALPTAGFDPGGIGKGLAADVITDELLAAGAVGALVSIGGDLRVRGIAPTGDAWRIDIEDPRTGETLTSVVLTDGAVATSSQLKRRWTAADGTDRHHLIDPATGTSSTSPVLSATVVAAEGWQAEVLTKVAFLDAFGQGALADDAGFELVEMLQAAALVVTPDLELTTSKWSQFALATEDAS